MAALHFVHPLVAKKRFSQALSLILGAASALLSSAGGVAGSGTEPEEPLDADKGSLELAAGGGATASSAAHSAARRRANASSLSTKNSLSPSMTIGSVPAALPLEDGPSSCHCAWSRFASASLCSCSLILANITSNGSSSLSPLRSMTSLACLLDDGPPPTEDDRRRFLAMAAAHRDGARRWTRMWDSTRAQEAKTGLS